MTSRYDMYLRAAGSPKSNLAWNLYGAGLENMGKDGQPELVSISEPNDDQMLVRIDSVSLCFSDVKIIQQGGSHPKVYNRDLSKDPTRLGHEVALTVIRAGKNLAGQYFPGQRLAIQPDIYQKGKSTAYGYTIPGGLIQYQLIGPEVMDTDEGACLLSLEGGIGYAAASMLEPWGCVMAAYTQRRRLEPKAGGVMWIVGRPDDAAPYRFSAGLEAPAMIVLTDVPASIRALVSCTRAAVIERNGVEFGDYAAMAAELTRGEGFDDIVVLDPRSSAAVSAAAKLIARRGTLNLVGAHPLENLANADVGRLHYDFIAFLGNTGPDIAASYGEARNRCDLMEGGIALFLGAGGPMGQMHVQRALKAPNGSRKVIATEINEIRLTALHDHLQPLAEKNHREFYLINPTRSRENLHDLVMRVSEGKGADDVVLCVPAVGVIREAVGLINPDGMLVFFAGMPNGTMVPLDVSSVYLRNAQYTGTSGLSLEDQALVMRKALSGSLILEMSVSAVGGMNAAKEGYHALIEGRCPGKIVIFPQLSHLPLLGLDELSAQYPHIGETLGPGNTWTLEAEKKLIETFWMPERV